MRFMLVALLGLCVPIAANADAVMVLLFSSEYAGGGPILAVLVFAQGLFMTVLLTLCNVLFGGGRTGAAAALALALVPVQVGLTALLVMHYGAIGAAFGTLLVAVAGAAIAATLVARIVGPLLDISILARTLLAARPWPSARVQSRVPAGCCSWSWPWAAWSTACCCCCCGSSASMTCRSCCRRGPAVARRPDRVSAPWRDVERHAQASGHVLDQLPRDAARPAAARLGPFQRLAAQRLGLDRQLKWAA